MGAAEFIDGFLDADSVQIEAASARLRARNGGKRAASPWSGQGNAVGHAWPQGKPEGLDAPPEDHTEIIRRQALRIGELTEEIMLYQTGQAYQQGFEHGRLAGIKAKAPTPPAPVLRVGAYVRRYGANDWRPNEVGWVIEIARTNKVRVRLDDGSYEWWNPIVFEVIG